MARKSEHRKKFHSRYWKLEDFELHRQTTLSQLKAAVFLAELILDCAECEEDLAEDLDFNWEHIREWAKIASSRKLVLH